MNIVGSTEGDIVAPQHDPLADRRAIITYLREMQRIEDERHSDRDWFLALEADLEERDNTRIARLREIQADLEELADQFRIPGTEHVDIPGIARIQFRTTQPGLRIADERSFVQWAQDHERRDLLRSRVEISIDKDKAKSFAQKALEHDGDLLPGFEITPEKTSMSIRWDGDQS